VVAVTHVPTNSGLVQPVAEVGRICREQGIIFLLDACQSVGQMPVSVEELGCDFLAVTARKFLRGPRGVGFLYVSDRVLEAGLTPLFPDLRGAEWTRPDSYRPAPDARRFENWEFAYGLVLGLGRAAEYALEVGLEPIRDRARRLASELREALEELDGVRVLDRGRERCAIVTAAVAGHEPDTLVAGLRERRINTSASYRSFAVIDFDEKGVRGALRISPHYYNTEGETEALVRALGELVS
jgi:selenocysteine lyase/cysteine desulfurase